MISVRVKDIVLDQSMSPVLLLINEEETWVLPIWIGPFEAHAIALALEEVKTPRPMTHDLMKSICDSLEAMVARAVVTDINDGTYLAELHLIQGGRDVIIDSRPTDAIALALRAKAPVFISDKIVPYTVAADEIFKAEEGKLESGKEKPFDYKKSLH